MAERRMNSLVYSIEHSSVFLSRLTFSLSSVGMVLGVIALVLLLLTAYLFVEWRKTYKNQLLIQFMIARFFYMVVRYAYDVYDLFCGGSSYFTPIYLDMITMGYSELVLVTWMFVFSKQMYDCFVTVFAGSKTNLLRVSLYAWLIPAFVSTLIYISNMLLDGKDLQIFVMYLIAIKMPLLFTNGILLIVVLTNILNSNISKTACNPKIICMMIILIFTFCCQQVISDVYSLIYYVYNSDKNVVCRPIVFIFFNILTVYHCAFSILFWLFGNKRTRTLWACYINNNENQNQLSNCSLQV